MKIGMILDETFPPDPRVENEAISLINAGHTVILFCLKYANEKQSEIINGIQVKRYSSNKLEYKLSALAYTIPFYTFLMEKKVKNFIRVQKVDAIHIHDMRIADAVFKANKQTNLPVVLDLHENRPEIMQFYPHLAKFPGKFIIAPKKWKQKEEKFIKKADKVIVVTQEAKQEILNRVAIHPNKVIALPNTVRKTFFENKTILPEIKNEYKSNFMLLYIGDTGLRRGVQTAIQSVKILRNTIANIKLVIVGKNSTDTILKKMVDDLEINNYVDFLGWKDPKFFSSYILSSAICISPLHRNLHHDTTYANKIFQYMSFGKPLLVSDAIAQKNIVENHKTGLVHRAEDVEDFSRKVLSLYGNKVLRTELGNNGESFVKNQFLWEHTSKKLIDVYNNLLN
ncbi:glycosyltransferase family 4 protein [Polaribacter sp. R77954]|uniref:glycosyltransferase family 4 protein n=1 Tax=Polaribacter sp. R77954 TaxID=3093870 RepID=UPI0037C5AC83